ncbi:MAG: YtxH domain-containing protein [Bacteroidia bacterium]|nr:YtxH domain-containing protein [Bacteroidia bacterium]
MSTGKVLFGVMAGLAIGVTLGILYAPDKGSETRKKISKKGGEFADEWGGGINEFVDSSKERLATAKEETSSVAGRSKAKVEETMDQVAATVNKQMHY